MQVIKGNTEEIKSNVKLKIMIGRLQCLHPANKTHKIGLIYEILLERVHHHAKGLVAVSNRNDDQHDGWLLFMAFKYNLYP